MSLSEQLLRVQEIADAYGLTFALSDIDHDAIKAVLQNHAELLAFVKRLAEMKMCNEDLANCHGNSGPYCDQHDWQFFDSDIEEARAIVAKVT